MSSTNTAIAPSFGTGGGGGGGGGGRGDRKRGRDDRDRPKPQDRFGLVDLGPIGRLRRLLLIFLQIANLGNLPRGQLLTKNKNLRTLNDRVQVVEGWVRGLITAPRHVKENNFSHMAEAFLHVLQSADRLGIHDQVIALLVEILSDMATEED